MQTHQPASLTSVAAQSTTSNRRGIIRTRLGDSKSLDDTESAEIFDFLRSLHELRELPSGELRALATTCRIANYASGESIAIEGDDQSLYGFIVMSGLIAMLKTSINGKELIVELLQSKDTFGLLLNLAEQRVPAQLTSRPIRKTRVIMVPIRAFDDVLRARPELFRLLVGHLILCLQSSYRLSRGLAHDRVEIRIAAVLSSLALKFAENLPQKDSPTIRFTRQQLADLTGTTPETAIRVTRQMQRDGILDISRPGIIRILKLDELQLLVEA
jgi:CRP-like cAMP-binding protein